MDDHKCLDTEEHIRKVLTQAKDESDEDYKYRLLTRTTGTTDPDLQIARHEIQALCNDLEKRVLKMEQDDFYNKICERIHGIADLMESDVEPTDFRHRRY